MRGSLESQQELSLDADGFRAQSATLSVSLSLCLTHNFFQLNFSVFDSLFFSSFSLCLSLTEFLSVSISVCLSSVSFSVSLCRSFSAGVVGNFVLTDRESLLVV